MNGGDWDQLTAGVLAGLNEAKLDRHRRVITSLSPTWVLWQGRQYLNFASNDYLGLTHHPAVVRAAQLSSAGAAASPLITGYTSHHQRAEEHIPRWKGTGSAMLFPSGYQANFAAVQTIAAIAEKSGRSMRFLLDKLAHASLIDAVRASGASFRTFPHNHLPKLQRLLEDAPAEEIQVVVTESIFSMDGDAADLKGLAELKSRHPFLLLLDEAHATGVYGPLGSGLAAELDLRSIVDVTIITLSKALGCSGGAVCGSRVFCDAMVNLARAYIYSTSISPMIAAAADAAISVCETEPHLQQRVRQLARHVRTELQQSGWDIPAGDSPIVPIIMGTESAALAAAESLADAGILALAIRPPTVPKGTSRLRITLSSAHSDEEIERLLRAMAELKKSAQ
jgi:8-amino-7-oxononanoate synthase